MWTARSRAGWLEVQDKGCESQFHPSGITGQLEVEGEKITAYPSSRRGERSNRKPETFVVQSGSDADIVAKTSKSPPKRHKWPAKVNTIRIKGVSKIGLRR